MSKPFGMTSAFEIVIPERVQNVIFDAVREAINVGMTVEEFRKEAAQCWQICLDDDKKSAAESWRG